MVKISQTSEINTILQRRKDYPSEQKRDHGMRFLNKAIVFKYIEGSAAKFIKLLFGYLNKKWCIHPIPLPKSIFQIKDVSKKVSAELQCFRKIKPNYAPDNLKSVIIVRDPKDCLIDTAQRLKHNKWLREFKLFKIRNPEFVSKMTHKSVTHIAKCLLKNDKSALYFIPSYIIKQSYNRVLNHYSKYPEKYLVAKIESIVPEYFGGPPVQEQVKNIGEMLSFLNREIPEEDLKKALVLLNRKTRKITKSEIQDKKDRIITKLNIQVGIWKKYFTEDMLLNFEVEWGDISEKLGYKQ